MGANRYIDGAHAACYVEVIDMRSKPTGYSLGAVQYWITREAKFTGRKAAFSDELAQEAMQWWATRPYGDGGFADRKQAMKGLRAHLSTHARKKYGVIGSLVFMLFINIVISIVTKMIIKWLFGNAEEQKAVYENRGIYFVEPINPAKDTE
jgi:hypothetical protein